MLLAVNQISLPLLQEVIQLHAQQYFQFHIALAKPAPCQSIRQLKSIYITTHSGGKHEQKYVLNCNKTLMLTKLMLFTKGIS